MVSSPAKIVIQGKKPLYGHVRVSGSKNAADSALAACLLTGEECVLENVPEIEDVWIMGALVQSRPDGLAESIEPVMVPAGGTT